MADRKRVIEGPTHPTLGDAVLRARPKVFLYEICWTKQVYRAANIPVEARAVAEVTNVIRRASEQNCGTNNQR